MTKQNINVRNLQHVDAYLFYKNFKISYDHDVDYIKWEAESVVDGSTLWEFTLESLLEKIDEITNM